MYSEEPIKINNMAGEAKISDVRMEPAKNGVIISYCEKTEKKGSKGTYDNCSYSYPKEVYDFDSDETKDAKFDEAFNRFKELWKQAHNY